MPRPFVSSERRVDLLSEFTRLNTQGGHTSAVSKDPDMKDPFDKKDTDKKEIEKKDLKEKEKDKEKEQEQPPGRASSDEAIHASMGDTNVAHGALSHMEIGKRWAEKPAKLIKRDPPV